MINDGKDNANREKKQTLDCFSEAQFIFTFFFVEIMQAQKDHLPSANKTLVEAVIMLQRTIV